MIVYKNKRKRIFVVRAMKIPFHKITFTLFRMTKGKYIQSSDKEIGNISIVREYDNKSDSIYTTHSYIDKTSDRGKGYGIVLYSVAIDYAIANKCIISSSSSPSTLAERLWKSKRLRKKYKIVRRLAGHSSTWNQRIGKWINKAALAYRVIGRR